MTAQEIFQSSVEAMKQLLTKQDMADSIKRAKERGEEGNIALLEKEREGVNELVREIVDAGGSTDILKAERPEVIDAVVMRYLKNREVFMKTFPDGIEGVDPDRFLIWASIMISPADESPASWRDMEAVKELIRRYGLQEDQEHIIIPIVDKDGRKKRCFLLKRPFLRIVYPDGHLADFPMEEVIEAIIKYPELPLSEALYLLHEELDAEISKIFGNEKEVM